MTASPINLHSPTHSIYSDGECYHYSESASSLDCSGNQPSHETFQLNGLAFSSLDESDNETDDNHAVPGTVSKPCPPLSSSSSCQMNHNGVIPTCQNVIIVSSDDESLPSPFPSCPSRSMIVSIPLNLVTLQQPMKLTRKRPIELALSHFATSRKRMVSMDSSSSSNTSRPSLETASHISPLPSDTPISLKLKRSSTSNQWQAVSIAIDNDITNNDSKSNDSDDEMVMNGISLPASTMSSEENAAATPPPTLINQSDTPKEDRPYPMSESYDFHLMVMSSTSSSSSDDESFCSFSLNSTSTCASNGSCHSDWSSVDNLSKSPRKKRTRPSTQHQSKFSFTNVFSSIPPCPELVVGHDGMLNPVQSLSIKGLLSVSADHPIHTWRTGKRVVDNRNRTKRPSKNQM